MAKLHFKYGAMNSGKTDTLIKTAYNYTERGLNVLIIKPSVDVKGGKSILTRSGNTREVDILAAPDSDLYKDVRDYISKNNIKKLNCILVDEAQLLSKEQVDQLFMLAKSDHISVIAYGLRSDFRIELFPGSERLFVLADNIEKIPTMCKCGSQAEFNCRKNGDEYVFEGDQIAIDGVGETSYDSLCGDCYSNVKKEKTQQ